MSNYRDDQFLQAIAGVARIGGFTLKGVSIADDLEKAHTLTVKFVRPSDGVQQEHFDFEREDLTAHVNGRGEVEKLEGLQPGDLAETAAQADAEIAAAEATTADPDEQASVTISIHDGPSAADEGADVADPQRVLDQEPSRDTAQEPVGELAAAAKRRR